MRRARVKVTPNLGPKLGRPAPPVAKPVEDVSAAGSVKDTTQEAEKTVTVTPSVKESLRLGIQQRSRRDSAVAADVGGDVVGTAIVTDTAQLKSSHLTENAEASSPSAACQATDLSSSQVQEQKVTSVPQSGEVPPASTQDVPAVTMLPTSTLSLHDSELPKSEINKESLEREKSQDEFHLGEQNKEAISDTSDTAKQPESTKPGLNRRSRFLKVKPNIGDTSRARIRHTSVSETDGEVVRITHLVPKVTVNQMVPPATLQPSSEKTEEKAADICSERRTSDEVKDQEKTESTATSVKKKPRRKTFRELLEGPDARQRPRKTESLVKPVDRTKLTIGDLIYMNPSSNPMKSTEDAANKKPSNKDADVKEKVAKDDSDATQRSAPDADKATDEENSKTNVIDVDEEEDSMPVPQVTIGPDGEIILNETSLVIANPKNKENIQDMEIVHESDSSFKFGYVKPTRGKAWNLKETKKFYLALSTVGTDFTLMAKVFPSRTRAELKRKFKKEEQINKYLIDQAVKERVRFDQDFMDELIALDQADTEEHEKNEKEKKATGGRKRKPKADTPQGQGEAGDAGGIKKGKKPRQSKKVKKESEDVEANPDTKEEKKKPCQAKRNIRGYRGKVRGKRKRKMMYDVTDEEDSDFDALPDDDVIMTTDAPDAVVEVEVSLAEELRKELMDGEEENSSEPFIPHPPDDLEEGEVVFINNRVQPQPTRSGRMSKPPKFFSDETAEAESKKVQKRRGRKKKSMTLEVEESKPSENVEESKPSSSEDVEHSKASENSKLSKPSENVDQSKPSENVEQTKPSENVEQTKPSENVEQSKPSENVEQSEPSENFAESIPSENFAESIPSEDCEEQTKPTENSQQVAGNEVQPVLEDKTCQEKLKVLVISPQSESETVSMTPLKRGRKRKIVCSDAEILKSSDEMKAVKKRVISSSEDSDVASEVVQHKVCTLLQIIQCDGGDIEVHECDGTMDTVQNEVEQMYPVDLSTTMHQDIAHVNDTSTTKVVNITIDKTLTATNEQKTSEDVCPSPQHESIQEKSSTSHDNVMPTEREQDMICDNERRPEDPNTPSQSDSVNTSSRQIEIVGEINPKSLQKVELSPAKNKDGPETKNKRREQNEMQEERMEVITVDEDESDTSAVDESLNSEEESVITVDDESLSQTTQEMPNKVVRQEKYYSVQSVSESIWDHSMEIISPVSATVDHNVDETTANTMGDTSDRFIKPVTMSSPLKAYNVGDREPMPSTSQSEHDEDIQIVLPSSGHSPSTNKTFEPGSLVFVTSNPSVNEKGETIPGAIHVYLVSDSGNLSTGAINIGSITADDHTPATANLAQGLVTETQTDASRETDLVDVPKKTVVDLNPSQPDVINIDSEMTDEIENTDS